jgi:thiamine pyrophosphate-dependent acetolactate synthase large subunit-like protein
VHPDRRVVCFTGTSGLAAAAGELETAARLGARVVIVAFAAGGVDAPALMGRAESLGMSAWAVESEARFAQALGRALGAERPALIVVQP